MIREMALSVLLGLAACQTVVPVAAPVRPLFAEDFSGVDEVPETLLVFNGDFSVGTEAGNKFLELPSTLTDQYGIMFGPTTNAGVTASARFQGTRRGRLDPAFGVGLNGVGGFRLMVSPAKRKLELLKGDAAVVAVDFVWVSGKWTHVKLQTRALGVGVWQVEGKAWMEGQPEPRAWNLVWKETAEPAAGRASVWASPYSGAPIRLDDFCVSPVVP